MHCRFLYTLVVAVDACFRLKRRTVSNEHKDPILGSGWGYFVEDGPYREHLLKYVDQQEVNDVQPLTALKNLHAV